jgi:hypothetical protein
MTDITLKDATDLELLVDRLGMDGVVNMLSTIANEKADHIRHNWQDDSAAERFETTAAILNATFSRLQVVLRHTYY